MNHEVSINRDTLTDGVQAAGDVNQHAINPTTTLYKNN